jgi:hypothetical protein
VPAVVYCLVALIVDDVVLSPNNQVKLLVIGVDVLVNTYELLPKHCNVLLTVKLDVAIGLIVKFDDHAVGETAVPDDLIRSLYK